MRRPGQNELVPGEGIPQLVQTPPPKPRASVVLDRAAKAAIGAPSGPITANDANADMMGAVQANVAREEQEPEMPTPEPIRSRIPPTAPGTSLLDEPLEPASNALDASLDDEEGSDPILAAITQAQDLIQAGIPARAQLKELRALIGKAAGSNVTTIREIQQMASDSLSVAAAILILCDGISVSGDTNWTP